MKLFSNRSVGTKILSGYIIALVLMLVVGGIAIYQISQINNTVNYFAHDLAEEQQLAQDMTSQILLVRFYANQYIRDQHEADLASYQEATDEFDNLLAQAKNMIKSQRQSTVETIENDYNDYTSTFSQVNGLILKRNQIVDETLEVQGGLASDKLDEVHDMAFEATDYEVEHYVADVMRLLLSMRLDVFKYLQRGEERWATAFEEDYEELQTVYAKLESALQDPTQRRLSQEADEAIEAYYQGFQLVRQDFDTQNNLTQTRLDTIGPTIATTAREMVDSVEQDFNTETDNTDRLVAQTWAILGGVIGLSIILGIGLGFVISRAITGPMGKVTEVSRLIANGDLSRQVEVASADEVGVLADAFNQVVAYQRQMAKAANRLAGGDVSVDISPKSEQDVLGNAFIQMVSYQQGMAEAARRLAIGNVAVDVSPKSAKDALGNAFTRMIAYQQEMAGAASRLAQGKLSTQVTPQSEKDVLGMAFSQMIVNLRELIGQVQESAGRVASASEQLDIAAEQAGMASQQVATTIQQVAEGTAQQTISVTEATDNVDQMSHAADGIARGAQEQARGVQKTSALVDEMATIVGQVDGVANTVSEANQRVTEAARQGVDSVEQTSQGMDTIRMRTISAAEKVKEMGSRSKEIGRIVETIDDIADKTDMLALNAAVEAARAGEHGRGFAVVADQVRKLSEDSKGATRDIAGLIERVQETIGDAIEAMETTASEVDNGTRLAEDTSASLQAILSAAEDAVQLSNRIREAVSQLREKSEGVVGAIETVSAVVEENTAVSEEMAASSQEVTTAMEGIASVAEENSASAQEVSASAEEMSAQIEEVVASVQELLELADELRLASAKFDLTANGSGEKTPALVSLPSTTGEDGGNNYDISL